MANFLVDAPLVEMITAGFALCSLSAAFLVQCGNKRTAPKKKAGGSSKSVSKRSAKSAKKGNSKKSQRSKKSKKNSVSTSQKSSRKSARSAKSSKKGAKSAVGVATAKPLSAQQVSGKSRRSSKRSDKEAKAGSAGIAAPKARTPAQNVETGRAVENTPAAQSNRDELSLKSVQETQKMSQVETQTGLEANNNAPLELQMEPRVLRFSDQGGLLKVQLHNPTNSRQAIKVKCSDNAIYRVNPVYGYVEPGQQLNVEVARQGGSGSKADKLVFLVAKAPSENVDMKQLFKATPKNETPLLVLPLLA